MSGCIIELYYLQYKAGNHIDKMNSRLQKDWIGDIHNILLKAKQRDMLPNVRNLKLIKRFYNCVGALMTQQLEDMCVRSINTFVDFICDYEVFAAVMHYYNLMITV